MKISFSRGGHSRESRTAFSAMHVSRVSALIGALLLLAGVSAALPGSNPHAKSPSGSVKQTEEAPSNAADSEEQLLTRFANTNKPYVLQRGDAIEIHVYQIPELDVSEKIRPDGKISAVLLDDIEAAGLTVNQLTQILTNSYAKRFRDPRVTVIVKSFSNQNVFVGGEVEHPGAIPLDGNLTVVKALFNAGGLRKTAQTNNVVLLRGLGSSHPTILNLDVDDILAQRKPDIPLSPSDIVYVPKSEIEVYVGGEVAKPGLVPLRGGLTALSAVFAAGGFKGTARTNNVMLLRNNGKGSPLVAELKLGDVMKGKADTVLKPFDVVYVPRSRIASADRFVDQYIRQLIPIYLNAGFSYLFGATVH